jgi:hypothetical protein
MGSPLAVNIAGRGKRPAGRDKKADIASALNALAQPKHVA